MTFACGRLLTCSIFSPRCSFAISSLKRALVAILEFVRLEMPDLGPYDLDRQIKHVLGVFSSVISPK
jgi:hypothetical protein